ncbi:zinc finger protein [Goodfellowiella coeruleoviolacea]|uniref:Zinc-finger n=1 Tax=Goodfellowiella coeruleoviolacea TaxID=334858 RepID=A0AAE3KK66_9PSEU|nr:zinc finger protein [Goodfellowiella coeruleoviolacea]MCP2170375.1 zinc-finger [Goodfellowiella coeruleoviolacea]
MTAARHTFRWWPVDGGRHAIPGELQPGQPGETLCHRPFTRSCGEPSKLEWLWPTCLACYDRARGRTHVSRADLGPEPGPHPAGDLSSRSGSWTPAPG